MYHLYYICNYGQLCDELYEIQLQKTDHECVADTQYVSWPTSHDSNLLYPEDAGTYKQPFRYDHSLLSGIGTWIPHHEGIHGHNTNVT